MLLAEIHGKSHRDLEDSEDLLTSAVFGHLRLVHPPTFWVELLHRARTAENPSRTLLKVLTSSGIGASLFTKVHVHFWPFFSKYGEPDLVVHLSGPECPSVTILIEVKLHATKSGTGEFDQLARYLALLTDPTCSLEWPSDIDKRFLIYLTKTFARDEIQASIEASKSSTASSRMFGLDWKELAEVADEQRRQDQLLGEVADFLKRRGFESFSGFRKITNVPRYSGLFYRRRYFNRLQIENLAHEGRFFGTHTRRTNDVRDESRSEHAVRLHPAV